MGLLDFNFSDPQTQGLLGLASGLLQAGGPSTRPISMGQAIAMGLGQGLGNYQQAMQMKMAQDQAERATSINDMNMRLKQFEMDQRLKQTAAEEAAKQQAAAMQKLMFSMGDDYAGMVKRGIPVKMVDDYAKGMNIGRQEVARTEAVDNGQGQKYLRSFDKYGAAIGQDLPAYVAPERLDLGNKIIFARPDLNANFVKGFSPSDQVTMRGQNMTDARAREGHNIQREGLSLQREKMSAENKNAQTQILNDPNMGPLLVDKKTGIASRIKDSGGNYVPSEAESKQIAAAKNVMPVIDEAESLLDKATGSYAGMAFDKAARFIGGSTKGAEAISQLKVLEAKLMMTQPRMEGPQSNADVNLYKEAAGQIGDPTVPAAIKRAALKTIRQLNTKYPNAASQGASQQNDIEALMKKYGG